MSQGELAAKLNVGRSTTLCLHISITNTVMSSNEPTKYIYKILFLQDNEIEMKAS